ncbi:50S ribosomal protein L1 [Spiroplasma mirum ATCC 29335]|uniref:Large ribosomal subunit protein uL1 n=1 Tax=Spiroplasma mirum ATCC 29335 TaxID=838561 RepID=W0GS45_9MOLU|nr:MULTISPECIES: 50S ribosomal protein L1 [Spiroplasma]AHF61464.1 50S ribosomal protein L1 [Spiroplasma mirum ATCC 29335]AHI57376.1 50S ribosomal protein L1 [Spiroplasma mirum ATCC 29335]AKM53507.1 50S ribosomal protein L1 [Spiroplasma atrichopogonis]
MAKFGKKYNKVVKLVDKNKFYPISEAIELAKTTTTTKFDSTVEVAFNLNVDPRHADQQIRGAVVLPKGTGKTQKILVLTNTKETEAKEAGADFVGGKDMIEKIQKENWFGFDVIIATPDIMAELGKIGKLLGPKGLMPNPKTGTITPDVKKAVEEVKKGKVEYRVDKNGNIHAILGKASFKAEDLKANYDVIFDTIRKAKPSAVKGTYIKNIAVTTTMGPGIKVLIEL